MSETGRARLAHYYAGAVIVGAGLGRPLNFVSLEDGVDWTLPAVVLRQWGDFLDFAHTEAMISYGGAFAEALTDDDARDLSRRQVAPGQDPSGRRSRREALRAPDGEAREIVEALLEGWRGDHPEVVAYVEEWLDWPALRRNTEEALVKAWEGVSLLAARLQERGSLTGAEAEGVLAEAVVIQVLGEAPGERGHATREGEDS